MIWTLPFLLVVGLLAPLMTLASFRMQARSTETPVDLPSTNVIALQALVVQAIIFGLAWLALRAPELSVAWRSRIDPATLLAALAVLAASLLAAGLEARRPLGPSDALRSHLRSIGAMDPLWLVLAIVAAITEEFAYRGVLTGILNGHLGHPLASVASALLFGLAHFTQGWRGFAMSTAFGLAFQWLAHLSGGLMLPMLAHFAYDLGAAAIGRRVAKRESQGAAARP